MITLGLGKGQLEEEEEQRIAEMERLAEEEWKCAFVCFRAPVNDPLPVPLPSPRPATVKAPGIGGGELTSSRALVARDRTVDVMESTSLFGSRTTISLRHTSKLLNEVVGRKGWKVES